MASSRRGWLFKAESPETRRFETCDILRHTRLLGFLYFCGAIFCPTRFDGVAAELTPLFGSSFGCSGQTTEPCEFRHGHRGFALGLLAGHHRPPYTCLYARVKHLLYGISRGAEEI